MTQQPRLLTALVTPFHRSSLNTESLEENIEFQISQGVEGIVVLGTTGEAPTLTLKERRTVIKTAVASAKGRVAVWVGTGTHATETTVERTLEAEDLGADATLIVTPYYNRPTQEGLLAHYSAICEATTLPICLYTVPKRTGCQFTLDTIKRLAAHPQIIGIKDASGDIGFTLGILQGFRDVTNPFSVWCGDDLLTLPFLSLGAHGLISVASNLLPREMSHLVQLAATRQNAQEEFFSLLPVLEALTLESNPIPIKTAMNLLNMPAGTPRLPLTPMQPQNQARLEKALSELKQVSALYG